MQRHYTVIEVTELVEVAEMTVASAGSATRNLIINRSARGIKQKKMKRKVILLILVSYLMFPILLLSQETGGNEYSKLEVLDYPQSLAELLKKFEGRVVYIDLMASWCTPCIMEFREAKKLQSYFEENNIVKLFVTVDRDKATIDKAFEIIQNESLSGYFVSMRPLKESNTIPGSEVGSSFHNEIEELFYKNDFGGYSIPKYGIVDRNGEIVEKRAARPSNPVSLKEQLEKYLLIK